MWKGKPDKVKRAVLIADREEGGLKMPHIQSYSHAIKISWIKRLMDIENKGKWKMLLNKVLLENYGITSLWECNMKETDVEISHYQFLEEIIKAWCKIHYKEPTSWSEVSCQIIWYNSNIRIDKNMVFYRKWY